MFIAKYLSSTSMYKLRIKYLVSNDKNESMGFKQGTEHKNTKFLSMGKGVFSLWQYCKSIGQGGFVTGVHVVWVQNYWQNC